MSEYYLLVSEQRIIVYDKLLQLLNLALKFAGDKIEIQYGELFYMFKSYYFSVELILTRCIRNFTEYYNKLNEAKVIGFNGQKN